MMEGELIEVYKGSEIRKTPAPLLPRRASPDSYTVVVGRGVLHGTEVGYKASVQACRDFIDTLGELPSRNFNDTRHA
jgi:hypothetical protein